MIIDNLKTMEKIVANNRELYWVGWDVVERKRTDMGRTAINGVRVRGQWFVQNIFKVDRQGWEIPNKYKV